MTDLVPLYTFSQLLSGNAKKRSNQQVYGGRLRCHHWTNSPRHLELTFSFRSQEGGSGSIRVQVTSSNHADTWFAYGLGQYLKSNRPSQFAIGMIASIERIAELPPFVQRETLDCNVSKVRSDTLAGISSI